MKRIISFILILVVLSTAFVVPTMAATTVTSTDITATIPEGFNVYTKNNLPSSPSELEKLGSTYDEIKTDFQNLGYVFLAHSPVLKCSITLSEQTTKVSKTIKNLYLIKDQNALENAGKLLLSDVWDSAFRINQIEKDFALFFKVELYDKNLSTILYITVINSTTYTLCLTQEGGLPSENVLTAFEGVFDGLTYEISGVGISEDITVTKGKKILNIFIIVAGIGVAIFLIYSIIKDIGKIKLNDKRNDNVKKYKKPLR